MMTEHCAYLVCYVAAGEHKHECIDLQSPDGRLDSEDIDVIVEYLAEAHELPVSRISLTSIAPLAALSPGQELAFSGSRSGKVCIPPKD